MIIANLPPDINRLCCNVLIAKIYQKGRTALIHAADFDGCRKDIVNVLLGVEGIDVNAAEEVR